MFSSLGTGQVHTFVRRLVSSPSMEMAVICRVARKDIRSVCEANLALHREETGLNPVLSSPLHMKAKLMNNVSDVPERDWWRLACLGKLFNGQGGGHIAACVS